MISVLNSSVEKKMANHKFYVLVLIILQLTVSARGRHLLDFDLPAIGVPEIPLPDLPLLPDLTAVQVPELPHFPTLPNFEPPKVLDIPQLPQLEVPKLPQPPELPKPVVQPLSP